MTASSKGAQNSLRLHVEFADGPYNRSGWDSCYAHVHVRPVVLAPSRFGRHEWFAHSPDSYEYEGRTPAIRVLDGLEVSAQIDNSSKDRDWYGFHVQFADADVDLAAAERMLPVLRRIDKRMEAQRNQYGYPQDFVTFAAYFAAAVLGPKAALSPFIRRVTDDHDIEGTGYRSMNAEALRMWLGDQVREWMDRYGIRQDA